MRTLLLAGALVAVTHGQALAADQTVPGAGNAQAADMAARSRFVMDAFDYLQSEAHTIDDGDLRKATTDAIEDGTCIHHRARLDAAAKQAILDQLLNAGLYAPADAAVFPGGAMAGVFPPVLGEKTSCPQLPQPFYSAPGSTFGGHHGHPGGLPIHETFNEKSSKHLGEGYQVVYGKIYGDRGMRTSIEVSHDILVAAPIWHDWGKPIVFQWNADGSEFKEFNFGGNGATDGFGGAAGDARTGGHHIIGVAETMKRGLPPDFVITQACAHSIPTSGNEFKVVNWLRAAAIIAGIDPVANGYLIKLADGTYRLPPLRGLGDLPMPAANGNFLPEYVIHNISDSDFSFTGPSMTAVLGILANLAPRYGFVVPGPADDPTAYNWNYRNQVLSTTASERLFFLYANGGLPAVQEELDRLHRHGVF